MRCQERTMDQQSTSSPHYDDILRKTMVMLREI